MVCVPLHLLLFLVHGAGAGIYPHGMCAGLTVPELRTPLVGLISALATRAAHLEERSQLVDSGAAASGPFVEAARLLVGMNARAPRRIEGDDFEAQVRLGICCVGNGPLPARIYAQLALPAGRSNCGIGGRQQRPVGDAVRITRRDGPHCCTVAVVPGTLCFWGLLVLVFSTALGVRLCSLPVFMARLFCAALVRYYCAEHCE